MNKKILPSCVSFDVKVNSTRTSRPLASASYLRTMDEAFELEANLILLCIWNRNSIRSRQSLHNAACQVDNVATFSRYCASKAVNAHLNNRNMDLQHAYSYTIALAHSRVRAYGYKWRNWYLKQRYITPPRARKIADRYRKFILIKCNAEAEYDVHPFLKNERARTIN